MKIFCLFLNSISMYLNCKCDTLQVMIFTSNCWFWCIGMEFRECYTVRDSCLEASSLFCKITQARNTSATGGCTHGLRTPDAKIYAAQIHIPIPNRKSCKVYEDLSFLQKKWLRNAKSETRDTQWQNLGRWCYQKYLKTFSADLPNRPKYLGFLIKKKLSLGVHSPWLHISPEMCNNFG